MSEIFTIELLTQIVGFIAMFFSVFSFQMNKHKHIIIMQVFSSSIFGLQYLMLGATTGLVLDIIAVFRCGVFFFKEDKKWAAWKGWNVIFMGLFFIFGLITWDGWVSLLITVSMMLNTLSFSFTKPKWVRMSILVASPLLLLYDIFTGTIGGLINEVLVEISAVVGLIRYDFKRTPKAAEQQEEQETPLV